MEDVLPSILAFLPFREVFRLQAVHSSWRDSLNSTFRIWESESHWHFRWKHDICETVRDILDILKFDGTVCVHDHIRARFAHLLDVILKTTPSQRVVHWKVSNERPDGRSRRNKWISTSLVTPPYPLSANEYLSGDGALFFTPVDDSMRSRAVFVLESIGEVVLTWLTLPFSGCHHPFHMHTMSSILRLRETARLVCRKGNRYASRVLFWFDARNIIRMPGIAQAMLSFFYKYGCHVYNRWFTQRIAVILKTLPMRASFWSLPVCDRFHILKRLVLLYKLQARKYQNVCDIDDVAMMFGDRLPECVALDLARLRRDLVPS